MHEFTLLKDIIQKIESIAKEENATSVKSVTIRLGALSHISPEHFREHFEDSIKGTVAAEAALKVIQDKDETDPRAQEIILESIQVQD